MRLDAIADWLNSLMIERRLHFCNTSDVIPVPKWASFSTNQKFYLKDWIYAPQGHGTLGNCFDNLWDRRESSCLAIAPVVA